MAFGRIISVCYSIVYDVRCTVYQMSEDVAYEIDTTAPKSGARVSSETLHLVASYDKCREPVKEHLLYIIDELSQKVILSAESEA